MSNLKNSATGEVLPEIDELTLTNSIQQKYQQQINAVTSATATLATPLDASRSSSSGGGGSEPIDLSSTAPPPHCNNLAAEAALDSNTNGGGSGSHDLGLTMMQSSPPPHSYRHSRAYRHFKNPPQPHMCIRTITEAGEELFINVLSWTRIVIPQEPSDPIPLYGGMRVPPGNPRSPPIVFAVMANPEVLKDSGRHSKDPEERRAMVELMCDFVEAMNPGVKLVRNAVILKDRDISGELKDVWNAVQAQRDREREEQLLQQRQQQHYHNITTQQMFPKSADALRQEHQHQKSEEQMPASNALLETDAAAAPATIAPADMLGPQLNNKTSSTEPQETSEDNKNSLSPNRSRSNNNESANNCAIDPSGAIQCDNTILQNGGGGCGFVASNDQIDASHRPHNAKNELPAAAKIKSNSSQISTNASSSSSPSANANANTNVIDNPAPTANQKKITSPTSPTNVTTTTTAASLAASAAAATPSTPAPVTPITPPTKKEKLGGFLPNGCIFPRFKNNKHKDKDKEKESKTKEKTLLNALKKSKDKKISASEQTQQQQQQQQLDKTTSATDADAAKSQYEKNCINLESEVQKLDLNKIDITTGNDMFIKLKVTATSAAAK